MVARSGSLDVSTVTSDRIPRLLSSLKIWSGSIPRWHRQTGGAQAMLYIWLRSEGGAEWVFAPPAVTVAGWLPDAPAAANSAVSRCTVSSSTAEPPFDASINV